MMRKKIDPDACRSKALFDDCPTAAGVLKVVGVSGSVESKGLGWPGRWDTRSNDRIGSRRAVNNGRRRSLNQRGDYDRIGLEHPRPDLRFVKQIERAAMNESALVLKAKGTNLAD